MSKNTAHELWGADVVRRALANPAPELTSAELVHEAQRWLAVSPGAFRTWSLAQPWPRFCAVVRIVSGTIRAEVEQHE